MFGGPLRGVVLPVLSDHLLADVCEVYGEFLELVALEAGFLCEEFDQSLLACVEALGVGRAFVSVGHHARLSVEPCHLESFGHGEVAAVVVAD